MAKKKAARKTAKPTPKPKPKSKSKAKSPPPIDESASPLLRVKLALAEKYLSLAQGAQGKPKRKSFSYRAERYRRQVVQLARIESGKKGESS